MNAHTNQMTQAFKQVGIKPAPLEVKPSSQTITHILTKAAIPSQDWAAYVDTLTVDEARALYLQLHKMFGA